MVQENIRILFCRINEVFCFWMRFWKMLKAPISFVTHFLILLIELKLTWWFLKIAPKSSTFFICPFANWIRLPVNKCFDSSKEKYVRRRTLFEVSRVTTGCCWKHILFWGKSYRLSLVGCGCVGHCLGVGRDGWGGGGGERSSLEGGQFVRGTGKTFSDSVTRLSYRIIRWQGTVPWCWKGILQIFLSHSSDLTMMIFFILQLSFLHGGLFILIEVKTLS